MAVDTKKAVMSMVTPEKPPERDANGRKARKIKV
jgi:hypothetical protein